MRSPQARRGVNDCALSRDLTPQLVAVAECKPLGHETHKHPPQQVRKLAANIDHFGFVLPILLDADRRVVAGWGLVLAARQLGLTEVPAVILTDLSNPELRALRLALNRVNEDATWDRKALALEFSEVLQLDPQLDLQTTGFEINEIDNLQIGDAGLDQEDELPPIDPAETEPVTRSGEVWDLGGHRVLCGDACRSESYDHLLGADRAEMVFADPPHNAPIKGDVSGSGKIKHVESDMASGALSPAEFESFLNTSLGAATRHSDDGAIHFVCVDLPHLSEALSLLGTVYSQLLNLCTWNKNDAGVGALYRCMRCKHELIFVFKVGKSSHIDNVALGRHGRRRTNLWHYVGQNASKGKQKSKLARPLVKPVAMIADAILDCSNRGGLILDPFGGAAPR